MAFEFHMAEGLSEISDIALNLVMRDNVSTETTDSKTALIYYRFEDEPNADPQLLAEIPAGQSFGWPVDLKGRLVRFFAVSKTATGVSSTKRIFEGTQILFDPGAGRIAGENVLTGQLLHYYNDSGVTKAQLADATDATKPCQAFAANDALTGEIVRPLGAASDITGLTGKTPGAAQYLSAATPGAMTESPPSSVGNLIQKIGSALNTTTVDFNPETGSPVTSGTTVYPPSGLSAVDLGAFGFHEHIQLTWTNNGGTGSIDIERDIDGTGYETVGGVSSATTTFTDTSVLTGNSSTVTYRVRNISVLGYSDPSNSVFVP